MTGAELDARHQRRLRRQLAKLCRTALRAGDSTPAHACAVESCVRSLLRSELLADRMSAMALRIVQAGDSHTALATLLRLPGSEKALAELHERLAHLCSGSQSQPLRVEFGPLPRPDEHEPHPSAEPYPPTKPYPHHPDQEDAHD